MNKIEKLLLKISEKDRINLLRVLEIIVSGGDNLRIIKIKNTDFFRVKFKQFRIIYHEENGEVIIDSIKLRNENTYKNL
jgi:mRNA-degrading endonuclease RelE of RelBE toxin-antitoxin system